VSKNLTKLIVCLIFAIVALPAWSTEKKEEMLNTGEDFARPVRRFELRSKYQQKTGDDEKSIVTLRWDGKWKLPNDWQLATRLDTPLVRTDIISNDNPNGDSESGYGDTLTQIGFIAPEENRRRYGFGVRLNWPTASHDEMGSGKYQLGPIAGVSYYPENWSQGSYIGLIVRDFFDYAGKDNRSDIHQLSIKPTFHYAFPDDYFVSMKPDIRINWEQENQMFVPFNITLGKMITKNLVTSFDFDVPLVNDYDRYDWQIEFRIGFFFR
jgi:hypothetical protein